MISGPIALLFAPFPFYPLHFSQAGLQKSSQICVFLLQAASLGDFRDVSDIILMTSWCIQHHFDHMLMKIYRRPIEHLSKIYRSSVEEHAPPRRCLGSDAILTTFRRIAQFWPHLCTKSTICAPNPPFVVQNPTICGAKSHLLVHLVQNPTFWYIWCKIPPFGANPPFVGHPPFGANPPFVGHPPPVGTVGTPVLPWYSGYTRLCLARGPNYPHFGVKSTFWCEIHCFSENHHLR